MTEIDWNRMQPLRMAGGSHKKGSGFGCAMNVISYITGDTEITDFPPCADRQLANLVQGTNDRLARLRGEVVRVPVKPTYKLEDLYDMQFALAEIGVQHKVLTPEDALTMLRLGTKTIGTANSLYHGQMMVIAAEAYREWVGVPDTIFGRGSVTAAYDYVHTSLARYGSPFLTTLEYVQQNDPNGDRTIEFTEWVLDKWREVAGLDAAPEVPNLEGMLIK